MPRKHVTLADAKDPKQVQQYIEAKALLSASRGLKQLLKHHTEPLRLPRLRYGDHDLVFELSTITRIVAGVIQLRGQVVETPCNNCQEGVGPFAECVLLSGYMDLTLSCCANCVWGLKTKRRDPAVCEFVKDRPHRQRMSKVISSPATLPEAPFSGHAEEPTSAAPVLGSIHAFGGLCLPALDENNRELREIVSGVLPFLHALDRRDMSTIEKPVEDIDSAFENFKVQESLSWIKSGHHPPPVEFLVKPSGSFKSLISHRLNQPSFTTNYPENRETTDPTNRYINMVMGTAYNETILIYNQVHRRDCQSEGSTQYPPSVQQAHQQWTRQISESSEAKVEIVYGRKAAAAVLSNPDVRSTPVPLWGEYAGIVLFLLQETNFRNAQEDHRFRRVVISARHPQNLFYEKVGSPALSHQELSVRLAAIMVGLPHVPSYYTNRLWSFVQLSSKVRHLRHLLRSHAQTLNQPEIEESEQEEEASAEAPFGNTWELFFNDKPYSDPELYRLLPAAIEQASDESLEWSEPSSFPQHALEWWRGQKQVLFYKPEISSLEDVLPVLDACAALMPELARDIDRSSSRHVLLALMELQKHFIENRRTRGRQRSDYFEKRHTKYCYSHFDGAPFPLKCQGCGIIREAPQPPLFLVNKPGNYLSYHHLVCSNPVCENKRKWLVPFGDHPFTFVSSEHATETLSKPKDRFRVLLKSPEERTPQQTLGAGSICIICQDQTLVHGGGNSFFDNSPTWTIGTRSMYVEPSPECLNCRKHKRRSGRFVPKDPRIPSIYGKMLSSMAELYGQYEPFILAKLMDHWPPSKRFAKGDGRNKAAEACAADAQLV